MNAKRVLLFSVVLFLIAAVKSLALPTSDDQQPYAAVDAQILAEIHDHSEAAQNLEYISDNIGPRLTGSSQLKAANDWTAETFKKYGLTNVHLESWKIGHSWTRGTARARITSPAEHPFTIASAGWAPGTNGPVRGPIVYFDAQKKEDFENFRGKLKGAIVILTKPNPLSPPQKDEPYADVARPMQAPLPRRGDPIPPSPFANFAAAARERNEFFKQEGVAAVLRDSNKPHALLNMTGVGGEKFDIGPVPTAFITGEGYRMIWRLLQHGPVEVEIEMTNTIGDGPADVYNTVAEIKGTEKPDEVVILGAHLDSWDLATGSTDNGTGSAAVLEAARALAKLNLKPKRTIRFVLFSGEEEGLVGSKRYVEAHKDELDKISAVLVHDTGTGKVLTIGLHDNYQAREIVDEVLAPLSELKLLEPSMARAFGTDHASFDEVGVPGFWCIQDGAEYNKTHHSQSDTFDKVWKDDLNQGAQVLAAWAYNTAQLPRMLPRRPLPYQPDEAARKAAAELPDPASDADKKIVEQVLTDKSLLQADLIHLTDKIGPRMTGSPQLKQANEWAAGQFKALGLSNVHQEPWKIASSWTRGQGTGAWGRITSPAVHELNLAAAAWSASTKGTLRGTVVGVPVGSVDELQPYKGKLKGAIVLLGRPRDMEPPKNPLATPWDDDAIPVARPKSDKPFDYRAYRRNIVAEMKFLAEEKPAVVLIASDKMYGLENMSTLSREYKQAAYAGAFVTGESYRQLWRLVDDGPVEAEINIEGAFSKGEVEVYNTVAEIPGSEKPDEVVILGAHLDSWDLGTGATDNGTGSTAVIAAARALIKSGVKPKRTIRFILFSGEEQGLNGSKEYVKRHKAELSKISAVLVHDTGTGKTLTIGLMGNYQAREELSYVLNPLARNHEIGLAEPTLRQMGGTDHVSFDAEGVPGFWCVQDPVDYDKTHHSQADTIERVRWDDLAEGAQVMAVFAFNVAQLPDLLPRKPAGALHKDGM
ncbi:MAG: M20/M25/M40 family metallo-hydrolase [Acidobacteria bacterium]|nr:M20/M25/M40 family metallo-hydrolase [Acidobacteriota bacterium]MBS1865062.1 M20/M25/M40 family metallo-hydrolase [Acidobacteriota bacterium]